MNNITRVSRYGIPVIIGISFVWICNRIIRNEEGLKHRELELQLQLDKQSIKTFKRERNNQ